MRYLFEVLGEDRENVIDALLAEDVGDHVRETYVTLQRILTATRIDDLWS